MITLQKLFYGYTDIQIPPEIDENTLFDIALSDTEIKSNSLFFITEKVGAMQSVFDMSTLHNTPAAIVASRSHNISSPTCPIIRVGDARSSLSYAISNLYKIDYTKVKIIGITGTNGKTTTATLIYKILRRCGYKVGFIGTGKILSDTVKLSDDDYSMTTPDPTLLYPSISRMIEDGCKYIVMEVSSHAIALGKIAPLKFEYSIFTNLDNDHLDFHKSKDEYFKAKLKLFDVSKAGLFNMDDAYSRKAYTLCKCKKNSFGIIYSADTYATEIDINLFSTSFFYKGTNLIFKVNTNFTGAFNVYNTMAALRCVTDLGIKPCVAKNALEHIQKIEGRMEIRSGEFTVVIDYAHTPEAFLNCIKTLKQSINIRQRLVIVFGCGGNRDPQKRPLFGKYAEMYADEIIITEDNNRNESFDTIVNDIVSGMTKQTHKIINDRECAIRYALHSATAGDVVALIGKGHEKYKITGTEYIPFDERKIVDDILAEIGGKDADNA